MPAFYTPPPGLALDDLAERIAARVVDMYSSIEAELLAQAAHRILRQLPADPNLDDQIAVVRALQADARALLGRVPTDLAVQIVQVAIDEGTAAAAERLALHAGLPRTTSITASAASTMSMIAADLGSAFDQVHLRILRYPIDAVGRFIGTDVYQQTIARFAPLRMLGTMTTDEVRKRALAEFLEQGVTGFTDRSGRRWRIGSYTEMATRAATARAFVEAETHRYLQHGRGLISILGNNDACAHCGRWFGKVLSIDGTPAGTYEYPHPTRDGETVTVVVAATLDEARAQGFMHPNCVPGETLVAAETGVEAAYARWYEGEVVVIHTASGRELTITPNHPVLTSRGWVPAGELVESDHLIRYHGSVERDALSDPDHEGDETPISEVYETLRKASGVPPRRVPVTAEQFHGDGVSDTEVDVVLADRLLRHDGQPVRLDLTPENKLLLRGVRPGTLLAQSALLQVGEAALHPAHRVMSSLDAPGTLLGAGSLVGEVPSLGWGPDLDPALTQDPSNYWPGDAVSASELWHTLAGQVALDDVVLIERSELRGHVYNLQTGGGWYLASGLVVHNCACSTAAYTPGFSVPTAASHYDPHAEAGREKQRYLERQIRDLKRKIAVAEATDDPARAARLKSRVRERQKEVRELLAETGQKRRNDREQAHWADGPSSRPSQPPVVPVVAGPPSQALAAEGARARLEVADG